MVLIFKNSKIRSFDDKVLNFKITKGKADKNQSNLLNPISEFNSRATPKFKEDEKKKKDTYESINDFYKGRELVINEEQYHKKLKHSCHFDSFIFFQNCSYV